MSLPRRRFLLAVAASLIAGCSKSDEDNGTGTARESALSSARLSNLVGDRLAAARIGRVYLDAHSRYRSADILVADIQQALTAYNPDITDLRDANRVAAVMLQLVRHEYVQAVVVSVSGWILSVTEVRLYALVAMEAG